MKNYILRSPRFLFSLIGMIVTISVFGQMDFRPGFIIDPANDTIYGLINLGNEIKNARICSFRADEKDEIDEFSPDEILAYRFIDGKYYVSKSLRINDEEQLVFAEYLVNGIADLYFYRDENRDLYFLEKEDGEMIPLSNEERETYVDGKRVKTYSFSYIRMLKASMGDCMEIQPSVDRAKYNHTSLTSIVSQYHDYICEGESCIIYEKPASRFEFKIGPVVGYSFNHLSLKGPDLYESFVFESSQSLQAGIRMDFWWSRLGDKISFQLEADLNKGDFYGTSDYQRIYSSSEDSYQVYLNSLSMNILSGVNYAFPTGRIRPTAGAGLMFSKFIKPDFYYIKESSFTYDVSTTSEWHGDPVSNLLFGAYLEVGFDARLTQRFLFFTHVRAGYSFSNPNMIAGLDNGVVRQIRVSPKYIPASISMGVYF
jgi:hypothetical protein